MSDTFDFERYWQGKFADCLEEIAGQDVRSQVMQGGEKLSAASRSQAVIVWSQGAMERLERLVDEDKWRAIMTGCACQHPKESLSKIRRYYRASHDINGAQCMLQEQFEAFLASLPGITQAMIDEIVGNGWGLAGIRLGNTIIATKIPKSGFLVEYMQEQDPQKKRQLYCHCPRIRQALQTGAAISPTYCYCGAGFYKGIWEEILSQPVEVEVLETLLDGGDVCRVAIHLPI